MHQTITLSGLVATTPRHLVTQAGIPLTSFRLAADTADGTTNWVTVIAEKQLAINAATSISKGDRVLVFGKLKVRDWDSGDRTATSVEIEAASIGHDLSWGTSLYTRTVWIKEGESN